MKRILVVEDDPVINETIGTGLKETGYAVDIARTIAEGRSAIKHKIINLMVLDLGLPDGLSFGFCREIRNQFPSLPILIVTAHSDEESALKSLSLGVTDFIRKPFFARELLARINKALRNHSGQLEIGRLVAKLDDTTIVYGEIELDLTPTERAILVLLMENLDQTVARERLMQTIDPDGDTFDKTLSTHISNIRDKLKGSGVTDLKITSVYGTGYRLQRVS